MARLLTFAHDVRTGKIQHIGDFKIAAQDLRKLLDQPHNSVFSSKDNKIEKLLGYIVNSIKNEEKSLFPKYTTEQVIEGFFAHKFDKQSHIRTLIENLPEKIVNKNIQFPETDNFLDEKSVLESTNKTDLSLDDMYAASLLDSFGAVLPYSPGNPISQGVAYKYDRKTDKLLLNMPFADCEEVGARHFLNLATLEKKVENQQVKGGFNLESIKKIQEKFDTGSSQYKKIQNIIDFDEAQTPDLINSGDERIRSLSNKIFADLNDEDEKDPSKLIDYVQGTNELETGFKNFVKMYQNLLGLELEPAPDSNVSLEQQQWVKSSLETILKALNPHREYDINLSQTEWTRGWSQKDWHSHDLHGDLHIRVQENSQNKKVDLFSYTLNSSPSHFKIVNIKYPTVKSFSMIGKKTNIKENTSEETVALLFKGQNEIKIANHFLNVFKANLADNDSKLDFIERAGKEWINFTPEQRKSLTQMMRNIFPSFAWDDPNFIKAFSHRFNKIMKQQGEGHEEFLSLIFPQVRSLSLYALENKNDLMKFKHLRNLRVSEEPEVLEKIGFLTSLEKLHIKDERSGGIKTKEIKFATDMKLREINIETSIDSIIGLENLKFLTMRGIYPTITFSETNEELEEIKISTMSYKDNFINIKGLGELPSLKKFSIRDEMKENRKNFNDYKRIKELNFSSKNKALESIILGEQYNNEMGMTRIEKISGLDSLEKLKEFISSGVDLTENLTVSSSNTHLERIDCETSPIKFEGLENVSALKVFKLTGSPQEKITFGEKNENLKEIYLSSLYSLNDLEGIEYLPHLEKFTLSNTPLEKLKFGQNNTNLKELDLEDSMVKVVDVSPLSALTKVKLSNPAWDRKTKQITFSNENKNIEELTLSNLPIEDIDLAHLTGLTSLSLEKIKNVESLDFSKNGKLKRLSIISTYGLKKITGFDNLTELEELTISCGKGSDPLNLESLENFQTLQKLEKITLKNIGGGSNIIGRGPNIEGLEKLPNLKHVEIEGISEILVKNKNVKVTASQPINVKYSENEDNLY